MRRLFASVTSVLAIAALAGLMGAAPAAADTDKVDFEPFVYTTGTVDGQDGWSSDGAAGSGCAVYDHEVVTNTYGYPNFGLQSLRMSNAVTSGCFGDQTFSRSLANEAGETAATNGGKSGGVRQDQFVAEWDFASTVPGSEQPGLSVVASPDRGDGARMSWVQMADTPSGLQVNFYDYQGPQGVCDDENGWVFTTVASGLDRAVPHSIRVEMNFIDGPGNDVVSVFVDGVLGHTGTSWEDYFRYCEGTNDSRTVDSILFRTGGAPAPATDGFGFLVDNLETISGMLCDGLETTVGTHRQGGPDDDTINGYAGTDVICGGDGDDHLDGKGGNDIVLGEGGDDRIEGGAGDDELFGGLGADKTLGQSGDDALHGGLGSDNVTGHAGADDLFGDAGADKLVGKDHVDANDSLDGGTEKDKCTFDPGDTVTDC